MVFNSNFNTISRKENLMKDIQRNNLVYYRLERLRNQNVGMQMLAVLRSIFSEKEWCYQKNILRSKANSRFLTNMLKWVCTEHLHSRFIMTVLEVGFQDGRRRHF